MNLEFSLQKKDYQDFYKRVVLNKLVRNLIIIILISWFLALNLVDIPVEYLQAYTIWFSICIFLISVFHFIPRWVQVKKYKALFKYNKQIQYKEKVDVSDEHIVIENSEAKHAYTWSETRGIIHVNDHILIAFSNGKCLLIPKQYYITAYSPKSFIDELRSLKPLK